MKKSISKYILIFITVVAAFSMSVICAGAEDTLKVNGKTVSKGDIITYEYYIGGVDEPVAAAGGIITYDPKFLEYVDNSIGFDVFNNAIFNIIEDGTVYYSAINVVNGYDLSSEKLAVSLSFKVLDTASGSTTVTHSFDEIFTIDDDSTDITSDRYEDKNELKVNEYNGENSAPYLGMDADEIQSYFESTDQSVDQLLQGNPNPSVNSGNVSSQASQTSPSARSSDNISVDSSLSSSDVQETADELLRETADSASVNSTVNSTGDTEQEEQAGSSKAFIAVICVVFVILCAGAAVYCFAVKNKK